VSIIWILVWAILSFIILGATIWNLSILFKQKKAWQAFATKKGIMFQRGTFSGPCTMDGIINGYQVSFFTAEQQNPDARKRRKVTGMQINLNEGIVDSFTAGTVEMLAFLKSLPDFNPHKIPSDKLDRKQHLFVKNPKAIDAYMTDERAEAINKILGVKNADVVLIADDKEAALRYETANPLNDADLLEKLVMATLKRFDVLKVAKAERNKLAKIVLENAPEETEESVPDDSEQDAEPQVELEKTQEKKVKKEKVPDKKETKKESDKKSKKKED